MARGQRSQHHERRRQAPQTLPLGRTGQGSFIGRHCLVVNDHDTALLNGQGHTFEFDYTGSGDDFPLTVDRGSSSERVFKPIAGTIALNNTAAVFTDVVFLEGPDHIVDDAIEHGAHCLSVTQTVWVSVEDCVLECGGRQCGTDPKCGSACGYCNWWQYCSCHSQCVDQP